MHVMQLWFLGYMDGHSSHSPWLNHGCKIECLQSYLCPVIVAPSSLCGIPLVGTPTWMRWGCRAPILISNEEIASILWSLKVFKASSLDGLCAGFFQCFWLLVGVSVRKEVKQIFTSQTMPEYLNRTFITPIPKCNTLESLSDYHPISLCNTVYKIVTKVIVAKICPMLSNLVSPY